MKASIIITTFNRPIFLKRAIESCINQVTNYDYEIIVIDDNGKGTKQQLETELVVNFIDHPIVYFPLTKNEGACVARNKGIEIAKGDYIFFLDDDDEFLSKKIQTQVEFLDRKPEFAGYLAAFKRLDYENDKEIVAESNYPKVGTFKDFVIKGNFFTPMLCIRKEVIKQIGGFDIIPRFQDRFLLLKALSRGYRFYATNEQLHIMYEHKDVRITETSINNSLNSLNQLYIFIAKYKNKFLRDEWDQFLIKDYRMRGTIYYLAKNYWIRIKALPYFIKAFMISKEKRDVIMIFKSILK